jgi:uncharacterized protein involved in type VI secretion and phage assembly
MPDSALAERLDRSGAGQQFPGFAIAPGIVTEPLDVTGEGRVKVRVPSMPSFEPWARVVATGAGDSRGFCWTPQIDDEVLVAFAHNDLNTAYVLGGLWSTRDRPPLDLPTDFLMKRVIKTGVAAGVGHEIEFDDALQSIKITSSTQQTISIDPVEIKIAGTGGAVSVSLNTVTQTISIQAPLKIELKATQISIEGATIDLKGTIINVQAGGPCTLQGLPIKLN